MVRSQKQRKRRFSQKRRPSGDDEFLWLISLSDLMILLFIFFVVMFAFTHSKLKQADVQRILASLRNEPMPANPIENIETDLREWIQKKKLNDKVELRKVDDGLAIEIKDNLLFAVGSAAPHPEGQEVIRLLAKTVERIPKPYRLAVEGHTDDVPIKTSNIIDNWDLAAKRALSVLHALNLPIPLLQRSVLMSYAEMKPLVPNRDDHGRPIPPNQARNRRVTIRIF